MEKESAASQEKCVNSEKEGNLIPEEAAAKRIRLNELTHWTISDEHKALVKTLMKEKEKGNLPGVLGYLAEFGVIDAKYDKLVSSALNRALDFIVVDTTRTALECITFLKANNLGYASFIALDRLKGLPIRTGKIATPEDVPRMFELITVENERVAPVFYCLLRYALVAKDFDQGIRIALKADFLYRVATLEGVLINGDKLKREDDRVLSRRRGHC